MADAAYLISTACRHLPPTTSREHEAPPPRRAPL
jgi:hypothetical protein